MYSRRLESYKIPQRGGFPTCDGKEVTWRSCKGILGFTTLERLHIERRKHNQLIYFLCKIPFDHAVDLTRPYLCLSCARPISCVQPRKGHIRTVSTYAVCEASFRAFTHEGHEPMTMRFAQIDFYMPNTWSYFGFLK